MADFPIKTTIWLRIPGDNRWNGAGWGKPQMVEVTGATDAESLEIARLVYDALRAAGMEMMSARP